MADYGLYQLREERIHIREGNNGSKLETFCAIVQTRDSEERVTETGFYWIVRVAPVSGYLSDYERGQWEGAGPSDKMEYSKLCIENTVIDDSALLRSTKHTSSGSLYDPTSDTSKIATPDWLIGAWVYNTSCATSRDEYYRSDGFYDGMAGNGRWALVDDQLTVTLTTEYIPDETGVDNSEKILITPKIYTVSIQKIGYDSAKVGLDNSMLMRC